MTVELRKYAMKVLQGDMMTPISVYQSLKGQHKMLFESSAKHEESGRYSFIAINPVAEIKGNNEEFVFSKGAENDKVKGNVLDRLKAIIPFHEENYPLLSLEEP